MIKEALLHAARDPRVDLQIQAPLLYHFKALSAMMGGVSFPAITPWEEMTGAARETADASGKPVVVVLPNPRRRTDDMDVEEVLRKARQSFLAKDIPVFDGLAEAMRAIRHVAAFAGH